ncbi:hypothetical protein H323_12705 [Vibrio parahaemolyticus VP766]|nr:hypothetical protein H323_12705 [Vibrio parahaemolyticus VP766]
MILKHHCSDPTEDDQWDIVVDEGWNNRFPNVFVLAVSI